MTPASAQTEAGIMDNSAQSNPAAPAPPLVLHGGAIVHAEALAPVEPQLQAGAVFNEQSLPKLQPNNDWYWIPSWFAGQKHLDSETILQDYNFQTGQTITPNRTVMNRQDLSIGFQQDRNGQIWEFKRAPYTTTAEGARSFTTMLVRNRDPLQVDQNRVVLRLVETSIIVDKKSRRIIKTMQEEQINTYVPAGPGTINLQTSIKSFGADGRPQVQETSMRVVTQSAPFQPVNSYQGLDLRSMFRDFMIAKGYGKLLPDDLAQSAGQAPAAYAPQQGYANPQSAAGYAAQQAYPNPQAPAGYAPQQAYPNPQAPAGYVPQQAYPNPQAPAGYAPQQAYPNPQAPAGYAPQQAYPNPQSPSGYVPQQAYPNPQSPAGYVPQQTNDTTMDGPDAPPVAPGRTQ